MAKLSKKSVFGLFMFEIAAFDQLPNVVLSTTISSK
jgi:hypothetical protein